MRGERRFIECISNEAKNFRGKMEVKHQADKGKMEKEE
jgi:hypothetical protein